MKNLKFSIIATLLILGFFSCSTDDSDAVSAAPLLAYEEFDIAYGNDTDQTFDLYLPPSRTSETKTMILVHGGGWTSGDKADLTLFRQFIIDQIPGYAIVNMNYRLADENNSPYPMQINDITSVVEFLKSNQDTYSISKDIGFVGLSAGAHLSLLWSYAFDADNQTTMVCSIVGPTNFTDPAYLNNTDPILQDTIDAFGIDTSLSFLEEISPFHRATSSAPPTILFYGGQDPLIPTTQGTGMRDRLDALNVINEFTLYPDEGHGWVGLPLLDTSLKLKAFVEVHL